MPKPIGGLPVDLQRIATQIDKASGVGNADGQLDEAEIASARGAATARPSEWVGVAAADFDKVQAALGTGGDRPVVSKVGPGGAYESAIYPPVNGVQREVIKFGAGLAMSGAPIELPTALGNASLMSIRFNDGAPGARFSASVGSKPLQDASGPAMPGVAPLNGPVMVTGSGTLQSVEVLHRLPTASENSDEYPLNRTVKAGETVDIPLSVFRKGVGIDEIESRWTASYNVPDPSGRKSDEGKPFYQDGVYCELYLVDPSGRETKIDRKKFVDANEVDNSHDLGGVQGGLLRYKFFAENPAGNGHPISFQSVRVNYASHDTAAPRPVSVPVGKILNPGEKVEIDIPPELRDKKIGRVEVRWTDMLSGTWLKPGYAYGTLLVDGKPASQSESVQSPETQTFTYLNGAKATNGKVGVLIERDRAQIDNITVYFES